MASAKKCIHCDSKLARGKLMDAYFSPISPSKKFLSLGTGIDVNAHACPECGAIELWCKTADLKKKAKPVT